MEALFHRNLACRPVPYLHAKRKALKMAHLQLRTYADMNQPSVKLITSFAVPMGFTNLANCKQLNDELHALFLQKEAMGKSYRNLQRNSIEQDELFESNFELFSWPEPCIAQLREFCFQRMIGFIAQLSKLSSEQIKHWEVNADAWFHITRNGGYFSAHNHPNASWSAVYCVAPGDDFEGRTENGVLRFFDFKANASMYLDEANTRLPEPFTMGHRVFKLKAGDLLIFPSYLLHEVSPYFGSSPRITVAMNCWFKDRRRAFPG